MEEGKINGANTVLQCGEGTALGTNLYKVWA